jgi:hypothetical protein
MRWKMRQFRIALVGLALSAAPALAQEVPAMAVTGSVQAQPQSQGKVSAWRVAMSEVAIARYKVALRLTEAQQKHWPAVAAALRHLARLPQVDENAVRSVAPSVQPLLATLDPNQRQVAMNLVQKAGLAQYASLF